MTPSHHKQLAGYARECKWQARLMGIVTVTLGAIAYLHGSNAFAAFLIGASCVFAFLDGNFTFKEIYHLARSKSNGN